MALVESVGAGECVSTTVGRDVADVQLLRGESGSRRPAAEGKGGSKRDHHLPLHLPVRQRSLHGPAAAVATLPSLSALSSIQGPSVQEEWDEVEPAVAASGLSLTLCRGVGTITWRPLPLMPSRWKMGVLGMLGLCTIENREGEGEGARELTALEQREVLMSKEWSSSSSSSWSGPPWT